MKLLSTLLLLLCIALSAQAADNDAKAPKKVQHHVQFLFGNYMSKIFVVPGLGLGTQYLPGYSCTVGFEYKADFGTHFGLRTGINYFCYGSIAPPVLSGEVVPASERPVYYSTSLFIPIHFLHHTAFKRGTMTFEAGPDYYMPLQYFGGSLDPVFHRIYTHESGIGMLRDGMVGMTVGLGYERRVSKHVSIELMPDVRILNALPIGAKPIAGENDRLLKTAIGLSTYFTFWGR
jgi:hypothetical protein